MTACRLPAAHYVIGPFEGLTHKAPGFSGDTYSIENCCNETGVVPAVISVSGVFS